MPQSTSSRRRWSWLQIAILVTLVVINIVLFGGGFYTLYRNSAPANNPPLFPTQIFSPQATQNVVDEISPIPSSTITPSPTIPPQPTATSLPPTPTVTPTLTPPPANVTVIGYSVAGRPLEVYRFGSGSQGRMIVAGIHGGNEYNTVDLAQALIEYIGMHPEVVPPKVTLYILPDLNPDGEARGHNIYGRANEHNVDLNHNWPVNWQANWSHKGCWSYLDLNGGSGPASEPETQALMNFLLTHRIDALISYHSAAMGIFPGGVPPDKAALRLAKAVAKVSTYPYPPIQTGCSMSGAFVDWAVTQGVAALDIELTDHTHTDFTQNLEILDVLLRWKR